MFSEFLDVLRDPLWQFVGVSLTIISIGIALFVLHGRKSFSYEVESANNLVLLRENTSSVQVLYDGSIVQNVWLVVVRFRNSGNVPITVEDFYERVSVCFGRSSQILSYEIQSVSPNSLKPRLIPVSKGLIIEPLLLNRGDSITLKVLVGDYGGVSVGGRVVGVSEIVNTSEKSWESMFASVYLYASLGAIVAAIGAFIWGIDSWGQGIFHVWLYLTFSLMVCSSVWEWRRLLLGKV